MSGEASLIRLRERSGESDGILYDEYLRQEQDDCLEVMEWIAAQPWCNGKIGMFGASYNAFTQTMSSTMASPYLKL